MFQANNDKFGESFKILSLRIGADPAEKRVSSNVLHLQGGSVFDKGRQLVREEQGS
jgi:hypothetical protein